MKNNFKKIIFCISLVLVILLTNIKLSYALDYTYPMYTDEIQSKAAFVMDADSSVVLYEYNGDKKLYPASLTKVMTAIIVLDRIGDNFDDLVTFSYNSVTKDIDKNSVTIGASAGDQLSVKDCLYSLLLPSANDAANALAEYIAGSINDFALLMNEKAKNLGCTNTHFTNPSGLHDDEQYTTASDMAKILQCAISYPMFLQISSSVSYRHAPIRRYKNPENSNNQVLNTNSIMVPGSGYYYNGITSGKTGHTTLAGYNIAASARKHDMNLICVLLGGASEKIRYNEAKSLFDFYFNNYKSLDIKTTDPRFNQKTSAITINDVNLVDTLNITCNENSHITLPNNYGFNDIESKINYEVEDEYNRYAIGTIYYYLGEKLVGKCTLEGRNIESPNSIFTTHLDLSRPISDDDVSVNTNNTLEEQKTTNALIYRNQNGNLVISKSFVTLLTIILAIILIAIFSILFYTMVLSNQNLPTNKLIFRLKRRFRR